MTSFFNRPYGTLFFALLYFPAINCWAIINSP